MARFLSEQWLQNQLELARDLPERPGVTARLQYVVTGAPDGEVRYQQSVLDGRLVEAATGNDPDADVTFKQTYADAREIAAGELDASAAFMQGRVKVAGDMGKVMALMPLTRSEEYLAVERELRNRTEY